MELGAGRGIAIRKIKASDEHAAGLSLDIAAMEIVRIAWQDATNLDRIGAERKDRDAIEALLAVPDDAVARLANRGLGKLVMRDLQFLKACDVGPGFGEPAQEVRQAGGDTVHVERRDLQSSIRRSSHNYMTCSQGARARSSGRAPQLLFARSQGRHRGSALYGRRHCSVLPHLRLCRNLSSTS